MELGGGSGAAIALGLVLVALGAVGASVVGRGFDAGGPPWRVPLQLAPFGVLIGAGAAFVRGWDLAGAALVGAVLVPLVGTVGRLVEVRRHRARRDRSR